MNKRNLFYALSFVLVAVVLFSQQSVFASDFNTTAVESSLESRPVIQCTTYSLGGFFRGFGQNHQQARNNTIQNCIRGGGYYMECQQNVSCQPGNPNPNPYPGTGSYYDWGKAQNGWGYCYEWTYSGHALNGGQPVSNYLCEQTRPSYYAWGQSQGGNTYCYQWTPYGVAMNNGMPVSDYLCK